MYIITPHVGYEDIELNYFVLDDIIYIYIYVLCYLEQDTFSVASVHTAV